jgi:hypothetical protein
VAANAFNTAAVKTDGTLWAWGFGGFGSVGDNTGVAKSSPVQVGALTTWFRVAKGPRATHTVALYGVV